MPPNGLRLSEGRRTPCFAARTGRARSTRRSTPTRSPARWTRATSRATRPGCAPPPRAANGSMRRCERRLVALVRRLGERGDDRRVALLRTLPATAPACGGARSAWCAFCGCRVRRRATWRPASRRCRAGCRSQPGDDQLGRASDSVHRGRGDDDDLATALGAVHAHLRLAQMEMLRGCRRVGRRTDRPVSRRPLSRAAASISACARHHRGPGAGDAALGRMASCAVSTPSSRPRCCCRSSRCSASAARRGRCPICSPPPASPAPT